MIVIPSAPMIVGQMHPASSQGGTKKIENYLINLNEVLGRGNFSVVYRAINTLNNEAVAVKVIDLSSMRTTALRDLLKSEIEILKIVRHPNCLQCLDIFSSNNNCYIVTELCNEGDLQSKVIKSRGRIEEQHCRSYIHDIFQGLLYLSELNIVHRDIKVANIFLKDGVAKIADFGFAKRTTQRLNLFREQFRDINVGSPIYMAPEGLLESVYGPKSDVWAFGVLLFEMLHGDPPLGFCNAEHELKMHITKPINQRAFKATIPQDLRDLITKCLEVDMRRRISMRDIQFHPYMQRISRELGRLSGDRRNSRFSTMQSNYRADLVRSNSTSKIEMRNRFGVNRTDMVSEEKYRHSGGYDTTTLTPTKPHQLNVNVVSPIQSQSPGMLMQQQNSMYSPNGLLNSVFAQENLKSKLNIFSQASGVTSTTSGSEAGMMNFDEGLQMLHYCRLLYKSIGLINKCSRVAMLKLVDYYINWLLDMLNDVMQRTPIDGSDRQKKLKNVLVEYHNRYNRQLRRNPQLAVNFDSIQSINAQLLAYLDQKISGEPEFDQLDLTQLGFYVCTLIEVTEVVRQCRQRSDFSGIMSCKGRLEGCLNTQTGTITASSYLAMRSALGTAMQTNGSWNCV